MAFEAPRTVVASAAVTTSGDSGAVGLAGRPARNLNLLVDCTATSGVSQTLDLVVEWSNDGSAFGGVDGTADSFAQITSTTTTVKQFPVKAAFYRVKWTLAGTSPSFTFSISEATT